MNEAERRRFLSRHILGTQRLPLMVNGHPLMEPLLAQRVQELREERDRLSTGQPDERKGKDVGCPSL